MLMSRVLMASMLSTFCSVFRYSVGIRLVEKNRKNKKGRRVCYPAASTYTFFVLRVAPVEALAESLVREFHRKRWIAGMPITRRCAGMRGCGGGGCEAGEGVCVL